MIHTLCIPVGPLETNCYLVYAEGSRTAAVIDPGDGADTILAKVRETGLSVGAVLLTHGHFDHIGAAETVSAGHVPVYLHAEDFCMLSAPSCNGSAAFGVPPVRQAVLPTAAEDGAAIRVGALTFTVLHTPGHSRGSVCYLCEDCLFSGDTMFADGYGRTDLFGGSFDDLRRSLRRVLPYRHTHRICPGHGRIYEEQGRSGGAEGSAFP